jgi:hypothetical protein
MEEIKAGEFVRLKDGKIIKFNKFGTLRVGCSNPKYFKTIISNRMHYRYDNIVKHSFNIIDLIEVGDYVNGKEVTENNLYKNRKCILFGIDYIVNKENIK